MEGDWDEGSVPRNNDSLYHEVVVSCRGVTFGKQGVEPCLEWVFNLMGWDEHEFEVTRVLIPFVQCCTGYWIMDVMFYYAFGQQWVVIGIDAKINSDSECLTYLHKVSVNQISDNLDTRKKKTRRPEDKSFPFNVWPVWTWIWWRDLHAADVCKRICLKDKIAVTIWLQETNWLNCWQNLLRKIQADPSLLSQQKICWIAELQTEFPFLYVFVELSCKRKIY